METMAKKQPRPRRSFTPEFKVEVVELVRQRGNTAGSVARDLNLTETAVRSWAKQADIDDGRRSDGLTSEQLSEMAQLRKELREAREERDILKRAVAFMPMARLCRKRLWGTVVVAGEAGWGGVAVSA
jgi:transposase